MKVIIDASNLAYYQIEENSKPKLNNILSAVNVLEKNGSEFVIIADASLKHEIDDKKKFKILLDEKAIEEVPSGTDADHFILNLAEEENAKILSNDLFREFFDEFKDINSKRLPYSFKNDEIIIGKSQKPKKVKNILQNISNSTLLSFEQKRFETYSKKDGIDFSPLNIAKESLIRMDKSGHDGVGNKIEGLFSKLPMFDKIVDMVENLETSAPIVIFVLVNPKNYKEAAKNAGNISVTIGDRLRLDKNPLIAVRNDLYMIFDRFELNILYSDEVEQESPYNIEIRVNKHDESFVKKNSRNIASTIAGRIGSWKFPIVSVKPDVLLENPGEFEIYLNKPDKGGDIGG
ncbi:MAG: Zc3h12a-like ribonuclease [Methanobacteriaceae archaeon]|nr:Zc3h12a-like ribonuclease [Candidatus Methanorudis spinitermitis]